MSLAKGVVLELMLRMISSDDLKTVLEHSCQHDPLVQTSLQPRDEA